ncbi:hypothetical protein AcV5_002691 [Taiwanofungus camphoratus]|nr:hypothetical protein AcV5_002691 [Antrodia cinnamomea]
MAGYNLTRFVEELLEAHRSSPASFSVKLYPDFWNLNGGQKCLYNNQIASLLDDIRAQRVPVDFLELFDAAKVPFYDGCMIVELLDYRPRKVTDPQLDHPETTRVVLMPNSETLWADICLMNQKSGNTWTDEDALNVEARILMATSAPLCLEPDPHLARMANSVLRISIPSSPLSLKRKAAAMEQEDGETEKARRAKLAQYMNPRLVRPATDSGPSYRILDRPKRNMTGTQFPGSQALGAQAPSAQMHVPMATSPHPMSVHAASVPVPVQAGYPQAGGPVPAHTAAPPAALVPVPSSTPPVAAQSNQDSKKKVKKSDPGQSPLMSRTSATPVSSTVPLPIPSHLQQHYPAHTGLQTPPRPSQSPHPQPNATSTQNPVADKRPPSASQSGPTLSNQQTQPSQPAAVVQSQHIMGTFPTHVQANNFLAQSSYARKKGQQPGTSTNGASPANFPQGSKQGVPSQSQANAYAQLMYTQAQFQAYQQHQSAAQQRLSQTPVPSATPVNRSPMSSNQGTPQRSSPLAANRQQTSRSPMPPNAQQPTQTTHPLVQHNYGYAAQNQYNAALHMRPMTHGHGQTVQHLASGGTQPGGSAVSQQAQPPSQEQMLAQFPQIYSMGYPQMSMNMQQGRVPAGYWPMGVGRGTPIASGPHQMPSMLGHPQQMQLGVNNAVQGGVQGS